MSKMYKELAKAREEREASFVNYISDVSDYSHKFEDRSALMLLDRHVSGERKKADVVSGKKTDWIPSIHNQSRKVALNPEVMVRNRCVAMFPNQKEVDAYKVLRTKILNRTWVTGGNLIMITSALPGEGTTLTAINLAFTFAREFKEDTLLVDCDLKKQSIHEVLGFKNDKGLVDHLLGDCPAGDLFVCPGIENLTLISGGRTTNESSEIIASSRMKDLVVDMKNRYPEGYIFLDVPPILTSADALAFVPLVDHVLMVVQADKTPMKEVNKAAQLIPKKKLLGLVLNRYRN